ncbi:hypothetical protein KP509_07G096900 [Ceratopteris richardii]|nr:hypothetical protein KP509_07G096900 [Ceratopteris richardii]
MIFTDDIFTNSNGTACLPQHLSSSVSMVSSIEYSQNLDFESHLRTFEQEPEISRNDSLAIDRELQPVEKDFCYIESLSDEPLPTNIFIPILKLCRTHKLLAPAKRLHLHMCKNGLEDHSVLRNFLVTIYVDNGCIDEAQQLVYQLDTPEVHCWNTLIQGYLDSGDLKRAFRLYKAMERNFIPSRRYILMALLKAFSSQKCIEECQDLHAKIVERGFESDLFFSNTLINMYFKCGSIIDAQEVFEECPCKDIVLFSTLVVGYSEQGYFEDVLRCWDQLVAEPLDPDVLTLVHCIKACASLRDLDKGREIHTAAVKQMLEKEELVTNSLISMYAKCHALSDSQEVFDELPVRDVVSWSTLIAGYANNGFGEKSLELFDQMKLSGMLPNDVTFLAVLKACIITGAIEKGINIHSEITIEEYEDCFLVSSALVDMYSKFGLMHEARFLFDKLPFRNVVTWTSLMEAYAEHGLYGKALRCFQQMQSDGVLPNRVTYLCVLKACCNPMLIVRGRELHSEIILRGFEGDSMIAGALVDMYAKCGSSTEAHFLFNKLPDQTVISWTALIAGYIKHEQNEEAFDLFEQMRSRGILPEEATYLYILKACGNRTDLELGQIIHMELVCRGIDRNGRVGAAIVYLYSKNSSLAEAQYVFDSLPSKDSASWQVLMRGFAEQRLCNATFNLLQRMETEGVPSTISIFIMCLEACKCTSLKSKVYDMHLQILKKGFESDPSIGHRLLDIYVFHGCFKEAKAVFDRLPYSDSSEWSTFVSDLC